MWNNLKHEQHHTRAAMIMGVPALLMPYGTEISTYKDREASLPEIRMELTRFARKGYVYEDDDIRWCHVFRDSNRKLFLGDLDSLVKCEVDVKTAVENQMSSMISRIRDPTDQSKEMQENLPCTPRADHAEQIGVPKQDSSTSPKGRALKELREENPNSSVKKRKYTIDASGFDVDEMS